ncbi:MAG: hypothetical protein AB7E12_13530 [Burkholderiaceae bacterium]
MTKWIGVDLDGTLARTTQGDGVKIGQPIPAMVARVANWLRQGKRVRVLTARRLTSAQTTEIRRFLSNNGLADCEITNQKDNDMVALLDDKAIRVIRNKGQICSGCRDHAEAFSDQSDGRQILTDC